MSIKAFLMSSIHFMKLQNSLSCTRLSLFISRMGSLSKQSVSIVFLSGASPKVLYSRPAALIDLC